MNNNESCFTGILKLIDNLQRSVEECDLSDSGCSRPFLGNITGLATVNTRPITLYNCHNELLEVNYLTTTGATATSSVFRVKSVDGNCLTVTILAPNPTGGDTTPYISTNQTAIINLECVCAIQCLADTNVNV